jgi:hypothetical protein
MGMRKLNIILQKVFLAHLGLVVLFCTACNWSASLQTPQPGTLPLTTLEATATTPTSDLISTNQNPLENLSTPDVMTDPYPVETLPQLFNTPYPEPVNTRQSPPTTFPLPTSTRIVPPSPVPLVPTIISDVRLECLHQNTFAKCSDDTLGIEFEYPVSWGAIEAVLRTSIFGTGYAYEYYFIGTSSEILSAIKAGGRSKDFGEARGGMFTDFRGYGDESYQNRYDNIKAPICRGIQPNVILTMNFPQARYICDSGPGSISTPRALIEINLPENPLINGFVFISPFLSAQLTEKLNEDKLDILGYSPRTTVATKCDSASRAEFDNKINELIENIKVGSVDTDTNNNIQQLEYVAVSVIFRAGQ